MHSFSDMFRDSLIFFALSAMIFVPLEMLYPKKRQPKLKKTDLLFFWLYPSFGVWMAAGALFGMALFVRKALPYGWLAAVHAQPLWLQLVEVVMLAEIWIYATHRLFHHYDLLWKFHKLHHTVREMTWSATFRQNPVDFFIIVLGANLPAMILGIDLKPIILFIAFERLYTVLLHANLSFGLGDLGRVLTSPRFHHEHHKRGRKSCNFAGIFSFLDVIGRSYR